MSAEVKKEIKLEIGHVLFMNIVGYSKRLINEQRALRQTLNQIVRQTEQFRTADATGSLIKSPTGDGMALVFHGSPEEPVEMRPGDQPRIESPSGIAVAHGGA